MLKYGSKWDVTRRWPDAHALKQQGTGHWKVVTGDRATGNKVIGEGPSAHMAWVSARDALAKAA